MSSRTLFRSVLLILCGALFAGAYPAAADSGHARVIRLSLVQGDVRFARGVHGDPLTGQQAAWEAAAPNLPIRQGYVLSTDQGRAEVEFENGAMAFLSEDTVLDFYDLSLEDGAKTTRLILRQGSASFYVNPGSADYFSVTGGDFTVEAGRRASFRLDNSDDGSNVNVLKGGVSVLHKEKITALGPGQSFSMRAGDETSVSIGRVPSEDDFDRWVSGRVDNVVTATTAAQQYVSSPYYTSGFSDLYTYGSWYPVAGYGNCWRPYGVGLGWSPFDNGAWFMDPIFGSAFIGSQPWGWLPYHFGGWLFDPFFGWMWAPSGFNFGFGGFVPWQPVTGRWVRAKNGKVGIVPVHPLDARGQTPIHLARGVFAVNGGKVSGPMSGSPGESWKVVTGPGRELPSSAVAAAVPPPRVSRPAAGSVAAHVVTVDRNSSITYDPREHRFVNNDAAPASPATKTEARTAVQNTGATGTRPLAETGSAAAPASGRANGVAGTSRTVMPASTRGAAPSARNAAPPRALTPPPAPRASGSEGARSAGAAGGGSGRSEPSSRSSGASAPRPAPPASSGRPH